MYTENMNDIYQFSVPLFVKGLKGLKSCLDKTSAHAKEKGIDEKTILNDRLAPDMFPLTKQVQIACDNAKGAVARLSGMEIPKHEDTETTIVATAERAFLETLEGDCYTPVGSYAQVVEKKLQMTGWLGDAEGQTVVRVVGEKSLDQPKQLGVQLAKEILAKGGKEILSAIACDTSR